MENISIYLVVALGVSESLALMFKLKGNGILDITIKILKSLTQKSIDKK